ncbi:MAG: NUDIX domain-containing protein [Bacteroidales bacterium]|jgi:hypothetical protein|nr:NUDIX domain-containing protein [Bacteroidales bacterium]
MTFPITVYNADSSQEISSEKKWQKFISAYQLIQAAGGIVVNPDTFVLLMKRNDMWDFPKGKVEPDESIRDAAFREVTEETGLSMLTILSPCLTTYHTYTENGIPILKETHWFLMFAGTPYPLTPQTEENITLLQWHHPDVVGGFLSLSYPSLQAVWNDILANKNTNYLFQQQYT